MNFLTSVLFVMFVPLQIQIHIAKMFSLLQLQLIYPLWMH